MTSANTGTDSYASPRQRHNREQPVELTGHYVRIADAGSENLLLDDEQEPPFTRVQDTLAFHARGDGRIHIIGEIHKLSPEPENRCRILGCSEQARNDGRLVDPEQACPFI